jgi:hypothetical protein
MASKFPHGTLPPHMLSPVTRRAPEKVERPPTTVQVEGAAGKQEAPPPAEAPRATCDLASTCPSCGTLMQPEHAHYRCLTCGYRDSCCF